MFVCLRIGSTPPPRRKRCCGTTAATPGTPGTWPSNSTPLAPGPQQRAGLLQVREDFKMTAFVFRGGWRAGAHELGMFHALSEAGRARPCTRRGAGRGISSTSGRTAARQRMSGSGRSWFHHPARCLPVPGRQGSGRLLAGSLIPTGRPGWPSARHRSAG
jgi:hypothetical protein